MTIDYQKLTEIAHSDELFPRELALEILNSDDIDILKLTSVASELRLKYFGKKVKVHQINNIYLMYKC